jgi:restriction endonuclease S subunit
MTEWLNLKLGEIVSIKTGKLDANKAVENGKFPFFTCAREISRIDDAPYEGKVVLVAGNGDLNVKYYDGKFNAYQRTYFLTSLDESIALPKYIYFFMENYLQILRTQSIGTTVKYIKMENLSDAMIPLPTIDEQHKIVELLEDHLSRLDAALADVKQAKTKAAQFRRSLLQAAFTGNLGSDGTRLMTAPKHWEIFPLNELVEVLDSLRVPVNSSERSKRPGSVPYYGATGQVGTIDKAIFDEELLVLGEDGVQFFDQNKPKAYKISGPAWVNNHAHVLRPKKDRVLQNFLLHFLNQFDYVGYANGTTRLKLTQGAMNSIPVPLPSMDEQHKIVELLEDHLSRLEASVLLADVMEKQSTGLRRSLLQAAFTGQLTKEVASV